MTTGCANSNSVERIDAGLNSGYSDKTPIYLCMTLGVVTFIMVIRDGNHFFDVIS